MRPSRNLRRLGVAIRVVGVGLLFAAAAEIAAAPQSAAVGPPLVLQQLLDGQLKCVSPDNSCNAVNLFGPNGSTNPPLTHPGDHNSTTVQMRNAGPRAGSPLTVSPGPCSNHVVNGGPGGDLCGTLTVKVSCTGSGATLSIGPESLTQFGHVGAQTVTNTLPAGASSRCTFGVAYPASEPLIRGAQAVLPVTWTLVAAPTTPPPHTTTPPRPPHTTTPPTVATTSPPSTAVPPPSAAAPPPTKRLPFTGTDAFALLLAGLTLLAVGGVLSLLSRRRDHAFGPLTGGGPDDAKP